MVSGPSWARHTPRHCMPRKLWGGFAVRYGVHGDIDADRASPQGRVDGAWPVAKYSGGRQDTPSFKALLVQASADER